MSLDFNCWTKTGVWNIKSSQQIISPPLLHNNRKIESSRFFMVAEGSLTYIHINFTFSLCYTKGEHSKWEKKWPMTVPSIPDISIEVVFWKDTKRKVPQKQKIKLVFRCLLHTWFTSYGAVFEVLRNGKLLHSFKRWETKEINKWVKSESTDHLMPNLQMMKVSNSPIVACGPRFFSLFLPRFNFFLMHLMQNFTDI